MTRREEGKADRRRRITAAARDLIRETGDTGLSMRAIAARAEVSLSTPYNLFGSKRAIVLAVLDDIDDFQARFARMQGVDAIERIFQAVSITIGYYAADPEFYKTLWTALLDSSGKDERTALLTPERKAFWMALVAEAVRAGALGAEVDVELMTRNLDLTFAATMLTWVFEATGAEALEPSVGYGYALALAGAATDAWRPRLLAKALEYQDQLAELQRMAAAA
ncbi:TetR/AcrR family transcriptional regulator [Caulobacter sp. KR2-114]|uniref:TetR/AcrR family transcriptional regulator n=1 Tax=Caulobacter sp. KR2-114 TaxID=3400912 RepID=UPI003BFD6674